MEYNRIEIDLYEGTNIEAAPDSWPVEDELELDIELELELELELLSELLSEELLFVIASNNRSLKESGESISAEEVQLLDFEAELFSTVVPSQQ